MGPLASVDQLLPAHIRQVTERETPIPTIAQRAAASLHDGGTLVRCDIGQIIGVRPDDEVLYGPPVGLAETRAAIAELYNLSFGLQSPLELENVAMCTGAAEGLSILFRCFAHDKNVGLARGHWENYRNGVDMAAGRAHVVDFFDSDGAFSPARLSAQIRELDLALLVANFPCNPTGAVLDAAETEQLARVACETGVVVIADEVYARLRYDHQPPQTLLAHAPDNVISLGSASKEYLLPGARVGYVVSAHTDITDRVMRRLIRASSASPNVLGQRTLLERLGPDLEDMRAGREPRLLGEIRDEMKRRRHALLEVLGRHGMSPQGRTPSGTIFLMAALPTWWSGDDESFSEHALRGGYFSSIPGTAFGLPGSFRLSFGALTLDDIALVDDKLVAMRDAHAASPSSPSV